MALSLSDFLAQGALLVSEHTKNIQLVKQTEISQVTSVTSVTSVSSKSQPNPFDENEELSSISYNDSDSKRIHLIVNKKENEPLSVTPVTAIPPKFIIQKKNIILGTVDNSKKVLANNRISVNKVNEHRHEDLMDYLKEDKKEVVIPVDNIPEGSLLIAHYINQKSKSSDAIETCLSKKNSIQICGIPNFFVGAAATAYSHHLPLRLKPDYFYMMIIQGFSIWLNQFGGADILRSNGFIGEKKEVIFYPNQEDWKGSLKNLCNQLFDIIFTDDNLKSIFRTRFSTTTEAMDFAHDLNIMNATTSLVDVEFGFMCGIPHITLEGCQSDWEMLSLVAMCMNVVSGGQLKGWMNVLMPAIQTLVDSFSDDETNKENNKNSWNTFVNYHDSSGLSACSGWINAFCPYILKATRDDEKSANIVQNSLVWEGTFESMSRKHKDYSKFVSITRYLETTVSHSYKSVGHRSDVLIKSGIMGFVQWYQDDCALEPFMSAQVSL